MRAHHLLGLTGWAASSRLAGPWVPCITSLILKVVSFAFFALTLHSAYKYRVHLGSNKTEKKQHTNPQTFHPFKLQTEEQTKRSNKRADRMAQINPRSPGPLAAEAAAAGIVLPLSPGRTAHKAVMPPSLSPSAG